MEINSTYIIPWLQAQLTPEESRAFQELMDSSPEFKKEVDDTRFIWLAAEDLRLQLDVNVSSNWKQLSRRITLIKSGERSWKYIRILSAIAFIPLILGSYYLKERLFALENIQPEQMEISTAYGLVSRIVLPDNSEVSLNSGSTLRYPQRFVGNRRVVSLEGEAYFKVKSDLHSRFDVMLPDGLCVSAYGTEFNINAYKDQSWVEAVLADGHVEVSRPGITNVQPKKLLPGQMAYVYKGAPDIFVSDANIYTKTAWKDGKMVFRRAKMPEIVRRLSQHFNVDIELQDKELYQYEYSATFTTESLTDILNLLMKSAPLKWHYIEPTKQADYTYTKRRVRIYLQR